MSHQALGRLRPMTIRWLGRELRVGRDASGRVFFVLLVLLVLVIPPKSSRAATDGSAPDAFYQPLWHQLDLELSDFAAFPTNDSLIRRRQDSIAGSAFHWGPDLSVTSHQQPALDASFWFEDTNAIRFQLQYFVLYGGSFLASPATFDGDVIAPGQSISVSDSAWFAVGLFCERCIRLWLNRK